MNILFITDNFPPEVNAPATRTYKHCKQWVKGGHDVTVITCVPNFPQGEVFEGYENKLYKEEVDGIKVVRVWSYITANEGFIKRTLDYFSFAVSSFFTGLFKKTDVIVATSPQFFTTWAGWALSKLKRKPWIFELRDLWPDTIEAVGAIKNKRILSFLEAIELFLYRSASMVIPVTDHFKENLISRGIDPYKIKVVTNGTDLDMFQPKEKNQKLTKKLNINDDEFVVGYVGTHGLTHGLDFILKSIKDLDEEHFRFLFLGDGAEKENLKQLAAKLHLENVTFLDPVPKEKVSDYISLFDASLVPLKKRDVFKTVIPSKIFEQASMKKPILLGVDGQAREIIEKYDAGLYFEPENKEDFIRNLQKIKNDSELYMKLQEGCLELAQDYDREKKANQMLEYLKRLDN